MTTRRDLLIALGTGGCALPFLSFAQQQSTKIFRIGFLSSETASAWTPRVEIFRAGMRDLGYLEGKNIAIEFRWADGNYDRLPELAAELVRLNVDVIVTGAPPASLAAKRATTTIPIVICAIGDAIGNGLVTNLARPGGNITGSTFFNTEVSAKRIEILKDTFPRATHIAVLLNPDSPGTGPAVQAVAEAAKSLKVRLQTIEARRANEFERAFSAMAKARVDAVAIHQQPIFDANAKLLAELAVKHRIPSIGGADFAEAGCLIGYGAALPQMYRRAANFVDKILKGVKPGDIPVERATKFDMVVNMKTAKALRIKIPNSILVRADKVIE